MPLGPVLPGRIPNSLVARRLQSNLQTSTVQLAHLQDQVATGQKFFLPGESPAAAIRSIVLQKSLEQTTIYKTSVQTSASFLAAGEQSLQDVGDALNAAKGFLLAGVGDNVTSQERTALANEVAALTRSAVSAANSEFRGRLLFAGSQTNTAPYSIRQDGGVEYHGDGIAVDSRVDTQLSLATTIDGRSAFGGVTTSTATDLNPAITTATLLKSLHNGVGVEAGSLTVTVDDGIAPQTVTVDLSSAKNLGDVQTRLQAAFAAGPLTLTVDVDPATSSGLRLTPSAGTVTVAEVAGGTTAAELGIKSAAAAVVNGGDLNPRLTELTPLSALNGGTGIGVTAGNGLRIVQGDRVEVIDLSTATNLEDVFNLVQASGLPIITEISGDGRGVEFGSRLSGINFSIGENNGSNATLLGLRTLTGSTPLSELNGGLGVPLDQVSNLEITRRDGTTASIDVSAAKSIQQVIDTINTFDPGVLAASLNSVGNGIQLIDDDGVSTGALTVEESVLSVGLGMNGTEPGADRTVALSGEDVNPQEATGLFNILTRLETALRNNDDRELTRLQPLLDEEVSRFNVVRSELGAQMRSLEEVGERLADREIQLRENLSIHFDTDIAEVVTQVSQYQATLEATLKIAAQTSRLTLLAFL